MTSPIEISHWSDRKLLRMESKLTGNSIAEVFEDWIDAGIQIRAERERRLDSHQLKRVLAR